MVDPQRRLFFLHVMRTGGTTFMWYLMANHGPKRVYPTADDQPSAHESVTSIDYLRAVPRERWDGLTAVTGHFPYFVQELLPYRYETITILRDPVDRVLSFLRQWRQSPGKWRGASMEEIYDDPLIVPHYRNHMVKLFGLEQDPGVRSYAVDVEVDEAFFARAVANLESIDVIGFTEDHDRFLDTVVARYDWRRPKLQAQHVTEKLDPPAGLVSRIRADNAADIEFYEYARKIAVNR